MSLATEESDKETRLHRLYPRLRAVLSHCRSDCLTPQQTGHVYRIVYQDKWATTDHLLTGVGASLYGGRWNAQRCEIRTVYASLHVETAVSERLYYGRQFAAAGTIEGNNPVLPHDFWNDYVLGTVEVDLPTLDMTNSRVLQRLKKECKFSRTSMTEEWSGVAKRQETLVQALGRAAKDLGIPSILVPSARRIGYKNQVFFPDNVADGHRLEVVALNPVPTQHRRLS